ncbi:hypothetical protein Bhyg_10767 [Pseudolycoriella hygida]|uniref:Uncharacterized protein n=1 Tax=Pseudolycoriella hygida TaxID=35572 RepID=A0A9Q0MVR8_9DIPT|nr:hypothetical protein Bhyg_10767 [Pseudolycoriella hygida]
MAIVAFVFSYFARSIRANLRRQKLGKKKSNNIPLKVRENDIESNDAVDKVDGATGDEELEEIYEKLPIISVLIYMWGLIEILSLIIVLICKREYEETFAENFLSDLCEGRREMCRSVVKRIIYYKILCSLLLIIGAKYRMSLLTLPWFVVNVLGIFPYLLVSISAFCNFHDVYKYTWFIDLFEKPEEN